LKDAISLDPFQTLLDSAQIVTRIDGQMKIRDEVEADLKSKSDSLAKSEMETKKRTATIEHKQVRWVYHYECLYDLQYHD